MVTLRRDPLHRRKRPPRGAALPEAARAFCPRTTWKIRRRLEGDPNVDPNPALEDIVPVDGKKGYDVRQVILAVVDFGDFLEVQSGYARQHRGGIRARQRAARWA